MKKKLLLVATMFIMSIVAMPNVFAEGEVTSISDLQTKITNASDGETITLKVSDGTLSSPLTITNKKITLDLGGATLTSTSGVAVTIDNSTVEIKNGTIKNTGDTNSNDIAISIKNSTVKLNANVEAAQTGINFPGVSGKNKSTLTIGNNVTVKATNNTAITTNGTIKDTTDIPTINIMDGAVIECTNDIAIYQAGNSNITIGKATVTGATGIGTKAGTLTLNGTTVNATANSATEPDLRGNGMTSTGAAIQVETNEDYGKNVDITINGGSYTSKSNDAILEYPTDNTEEGSSAVQAISINGGTFKVPEGKEIFNTSEAFENKFSGTDVIKGGTFLVGGKPANVSKYIATGYKINANGKVVSTNDNVQGVASEEENPDTADINLLSLLALILASGFGITYSAKMVKNN